MQGGDDPSDVTEGSRELDFRYDSSGLYWTGEGEHASRGNDTRSVRSVG